MMASLRQGQVASDYGYISNKRYNNQIWQDGRLPCTGLTLQAMMISSQLCDVANVYGCISTSIKLITIKLRKMVEQYVITLHYR